MTIRPKILRTATFRLTALYLLFFAISVGALALLLYFTARSSLEAEVRAQITTETNLLMFEYREDGLEELLEEAEERIDKAAPGQRLQYVVQSPQGKVIFDDIPVITEARGWQYLDGDIPRLFYFTPLKGGYVLGVGKDLLSLQSTQGILARTTGWILAVALLIGLVGGLILSRRTLAQLRDITQTAREVGEGRLSQRIPLSHSGDELDELGQTLNSMLDRIENLLSSVRHVSTGIAHDLRTPLARLRNRLESLHASNTDADQQQALEQALAETDTILQTFSSMLRLAEVESGTLKKTLKALDLSALLLQLADAYRPLLEEAGGRLELDIEPGIGVRGDIGLLQQLLANLLENALHHAGSAPRVVLKLARLPSQVSLEVSDQGPGIPAAHRERALQPFERLGDGAGSSGFGLALVAAIARLHDAQLHLLDNQPGLKCRLLLPAIDPQAV
jgi:signal transduction histidine kinase